ncbi:hypothetical protein CU254_37165 [Amycolatopsis sp. AA4]|uniref:GTP-binding protein n=1 Tax=Actinomycetes TaxID=1760 RepID=UPI0001B535B7|nr:MULTISPECIES: ATP/GTP-binding protein [Actinomycetes]ATY15397.1 hypothetical protein CU254_37165 [Amycolatopsis sp. AA4]EFL11649.1 predicted protein [Streptomyces sp. AA4]
MKILVLGPAGAGKTTAVHAVSEIAPVRTDAGDTTAALDFGRLGEGERRRYLFGAPGQARFWFRWPDLVRGADAALVVVDPRRIADAYPVLDAVEGMRLPFVVGVNCFDGLLTRPLHDVRWALTVRDGVPVHPFDARDPGSVREVLDLVEARAAEGAEARQPSPL